MMSVSDTSIQTDSKKALRINKKVFVQLDAAEENTKKFAAQNWTILIM